MATTEALAAGYPRSEPRVAPTRAAMAACPCRRDLAPRGPENHAPRGTSARCAALRGASSSGSDTKAAAAAPGDTGHARALCGALAICVFCVSPLCFSSAHRTVLRLCFAVSRGVRRTTRVHLLLNSESNPKRNPTSIPTCWFFFPHHKPTRRDCSRFAPQYPLQKVCLETFPCGAVEGRLRSWDFAHRIDRGLDGPVPRCASMW